MTNTEQVEGIDQIYAERLKSNGINTVEALLKQEAFPAGRGCMAWETGIPETLILEWVNHADLWRIKGVGEVRNTLICWQKQALTRLLNWHSATPRICMASFWK